MGIDTHDCGGRPLNGYKIQTLNGYKSLRCCIPLKKNMVITVEPGVYFNDYNLSQALNDKKISKYFNKPILNDYIKNGASVRLEDDVIITENGIENMTRCPRKWEDVENVMNGNINDLNELYCPYTPKY